MLDPSQPYSARELLHAIIQQTYVSINHWKNELEEQEFCVLSALGFGESLSWFEPTTGRVHGLRGVGPETVPLPDKLLPSEIPVPLRDCKDLEASVTLLEAESDFCRTLRSFGSYCGCNRPADSCNLCWDGSPVTAKEHIQTVYEASDFLGTIGAGVPLNCETLEAFLHSMTDTSDDCLRVQTAVGEECGCPAMPVVTTPPNNNGNNNTTNATLQPETPPNSNNTSDLGNGMNRVCTLCESGDALPFPDKRVVIQRELALTCSEWAAIAATTTDGSDDCTLARSVSVSCGCPRPEGSCTMCPLGERVPKPTQELNWLGESFLSTSSSSFFARLNIEVLTCDLMESIVAADSMVLSAALDTADGLVCFASQMKSWICGCQPDWRPIFLTWAYRLSAMLSLLVRSHLYAKKPILTHV